MFMGAVAKKKPDDPTRRTGGEPTPTAPVTDAAFEAWFARRFGRVPGADDPPGAVTGLAPIVRLFEAPERLSEVDRGVAGPALWRIVQDDLTDLWDEEIAWPERARCIAAIFTLFERYLCGACEARLSHLERGPGPAREPDGICYMWWDLFPLGRDPRVDEALLDVMERCLDLPSIACVESGLHGLGHWHARTPARVEAIIDGWLARARPEGPLADYARAARAGCVQ